MQRSNVRARTVGEFLPALMRSAFEKYGFSAATILTDWPAIAGAEVARYTAPERLKWPRSDDGVQRGATLVLRVAGARGLEVEQMRGQLMERINACFGYRAVGEIRVLQAPLAARKAAPRQAVPALSPERMPELAAIGEPRLKAAFARMASGIASREKSA